MPWKKGGLEKDGKLPVNPSGGLKIEGHPIGATGVSMHVLAAMQLRGEAGDMQVDGANLVGTFNMGGAGGQLCQYSRRSEIRWARPYKFSTAADSEVIYFWW